jgi:hypothetical protein
MACKIISPVDLTAKISVLYLNRLAFLDGVGLQIRYRGFLF